MKKLTFLIHNGEYEQFLEQLRALGVAHVIQTQQGAVLDTALNEDIALLGRCKTALRELEPLVR
ncbi:MAG: V-type ATP synthase subunit I, partial [Bacteroidaceae bacterium]|nr:V-type ATP synthase subunit I [Bacteroidaceae bacterium]